MQHCCWSCSYAICCWHPEWQVLMGIQIWLTIHSTQVYIFIIWPMFDCFTIKKKNFAKPHTLINCNWIVLQSLRVQRRCWTLRFTCCWNIVNSRTRAQRTNRSCLKCSWKHSTTPDALAASRTERPSLVSAGEKHRHTVTFNHNPIQYISQPVSLHFSSTFLTFTHVRKWSLFSQKSMLSRSSEDDLERITVFCNIN